MLKVISGAALLATALSTPAMAANWDSFYVGGVGTLGVMSSNNNTNEVGCCSDLGAEGVTSNLSGWGGGIGATIGKNWQDGSFVWGLEGDMSWVHFKNSHTLTYVDGSDTEGFTHSTTWDWYATVRGRVGLDVDDTLVYATGGVAFVGLKNRAQESYSDTEGSSTDGFSESKVEVGIALGAGIERHFDENLSFKAEFLYIGLPNGTDNTITEADSDGEHGSCSDCGVANTYSSSAEIFRVGLNYALDQ